MKYLIVGLGNIGEEYSNTRHNIGFKVLDAFAEASNFSFNDKRYGFVAETKFKARNLILLKPSTYMNRSGLAINYWLKKEKIPVDRMLVLVDDLALPFGSLRLRAKGGDGGHNGLANINQVLGGSKYARLRIGIGDDFSRGKQVNYVLGEWDKTEQEQLPGLMDNCINFIKDFTTIGVELTMTRNNKR
ncbi:MAG: aminoacyl-tRNA hydrolase [Bacteroidales bacterium]|nr:aminoacyl-tRNA hydrolase [Bacteroidales bacterium]